jgi:hypothetical protein
MAREVQTTLVIWFAGEWTTGGETGGGFVNEIMKE